MIMKVKASNIARILADVDTNMEQVKEIHIQPGKVSILLHEDGHDLMREYGVEDNA